MLVASAEKGPGSWYQNHYAGSRISRSADGGRTRQIVRQGFPERPLRTAFAAMSLEDWGDSFSILGATATGEGGCSDAGGEARRQGAARPAPHSRGPHH